MNNHIHTPDYMTITFRWDDCRTNCKECGKRIIWRGKPNDIIKQLPANVEWRTKKEHYFARSVTHA